MTRLRADEQFSVRLARELADSIAGNREVEYAQEADQRFAFAKCVGAAGVLLTDLLQIIDRLDGAS